MSTYKSSLPKCSEVCWANASRTSRSAQLVAPLDGPVPKSGATFCWKQPADRSRGYQLAVKVKTRLKPSSSLASDAQWASTAAYADPIGSRQSADKTKWNAANVANSPKTVYKNVDVASGRWLDVSTRQGLAAGEPEAVPYDRAQFLLAVRTFQPKYKSGGKTYGPYHGPWVYGTLDLVFRAPAEVVQVLPMADGGVSVRISTPWQRGGSKAVVGKLFRQKANGSFYTTSCLRGKKTYALEGAAADVVEVDASDGASDVDEGALAELEASEPGEAVLQFDIPASDLKAAVVPGRAVKLEGFSFVTCDGVATDLSGEYAVDGLSSTMPPPELTAEADGERQLTVSAAHPAADATSWEQWACSLSYTDSDGELRSVEPTSCAGGGDGVSWTFRPPMDVALTASVRVYDEARGRNDAVMQCEVPSGGRIVIHYGPQGFNAAGEFLGASCLALAAGHGGLSMDTERPMESELPHGRGRPVAYFGEGVKKKVSLEGHFGEGADGCADRDSALRFADELGPCLLRAPGGARMLCAVSSCTLKRVDGRYVSLSFDAEEVS